MTVPKERLQQYTDLQGRNYVACWPQDVEAEPWFQDMLESYGLETLTRLFPYQTLVLDPETGFTRTYNPCSYNAKLTNGFHLLAAKLRDAGGDPNQLREYGLKLAEAYPDHDEPEVRDISPPTSSVFVATEQDGYGLKLNDLPETIKLEAIRGWHPNRDANGNYMSPQQYTSPYWNPYPGGFNYFANQNPYSYMPSYLPRYMKNEDYPF
jgi:hypothetical protein